MPENTSGSPSAGDILTFAQGMETRDQSSLAGLIDPDYLLGQTRATTIIYTIDGRLYTAKGDVAHMHIESYIIRNDEDNLRNSNFTRYFKRAMSVGDKNERRLFLEKHAALYGRAGLLFRDSGQVDDIEGVAVGFVVAFWNDTQEIYNKLLAGCLKALEAEDVLPGDMPIEVHTPFDVSGYEAGTEDTKRQRETTPEQRKRYELQRRMHLATGNEKKEIRKKLGLWTGKKALHPWQREMEKAGEIGFGQKWWSSQSEQIEYISQVISEDII